jgi:kynurenine 3-monooxygenase
MKALRIINLEEEVVNAGVKCYGRQVRSKNSASFFTPYGTGNMESGDYLLSISRVALNKILLARMISQKRITVLFGHTCTNADLPSGELTFKDCVSKSELQVKADVILGTDGVWSMIRQKMMRQTTVEFSQRFAHQQYKELYTPAGDTDHSFVYGGDGNAGALHLWPCKDFMLLAMPNVDQSFSTTLFAPKEIFRELEAAGPTGVRAFFTEHFPEASSFMPTLEQDFADNPVGQLVETRCFPYHFSPSAANPLDGKTTAKTVTTLLMGDAAHAMYPFMGQGTNAAFEDVLVLRELLQKHNADGSEKWKEVAAEFSTARKPQLDALADMAAEHDKTLCTMAFSPARILRNVIAKFGGERFRPLYSAIAFSAEPYGSCIAREKEQMRVLQQGVTVASYALVAAAAAGATMLLATALDGGSTVSAVTSRTC